jgi:hypothetical protein
MHRGGGVEEELLAISPPPEFQDITAPPPAVFRDLSPCSSREGSKGHQQVWDFASRISFNILNEAMVIAIEKVLSEQHGGGCNNSDCATGISPTPFHSFLPNSAGSRRFENI